MKAAKKVKSNTKTTGCSPVSAVGIDLRDCYSHWCALSADGEVAERGRVKTTAEALSEQAASWAGIPVAIENGTHSGWVSRTLETTGCKVCVANPSRWRGTAHSSKNDANDAEALARVVRLDPKLLYPIIHRTQQQQEDLSVIRVRAQLVKARTLLVNTARGTVKSLGSRLPATDADAFHNTSWSNTATEYRNLPLNVLTESTTNPRRIFADVALKELAESIRVQGVLSPLLVRPLSGQNFEIVAGARRYRAAQISDRNLQAFHYNVVAFGKQGHFAKQLQTGTRIKLVVQAQSQPDNIASIPLLTATFVRPVQPVARG